MGFFKGRKGKREERRENRGWRTVAGDDELLQFDDAGVEGGDEGVEGGSRLLQIHRCYRSPESPLLLSLGPHSLAVPKLNLLNALLPLTAWEGNFQLFADLSVLNKKFLKCTPKT